MKRFAVYPVLCGASVCAFLLSAGMTLAAWNVQGSTVNAVSMSSVKGQIVEEYEQGQVVYPNGTVDKTVQVLNTGSADAFVRVKIEKVWGDSRDENGQILINPDLSTDNIAIAYNTDEWTYHEEDGYYYYTAVLKPGETTPSLFESFTVDGADTGGAYKNKEADIIVNMEMVQAAGNGLSYWGTSCEELGIVYTPSGGEELVTRVEFGGMEKGFSFDVNGGDLFSNFKNLVPGESRSQTVEITNSWNEQTELFLWADFIDQTHATDENRALIEQLLHEYAMIVITDENGTLLYDGAVWGSPDTDSEGMDSMKYPKSLGTFSAGQTKQLNIALRLDSRMDNEYQELLGLIKWVFSAQGDAEEPSSEEPSSEEPSSEEPSSEEPSSEEPSSEEPSSEEPGSEEPSSEEPTSEEPETTQKPIISDTPGNPTGDIWNVKLYAVLTLISFVMIIVTYTKGRTNRKEHA